MCEEIIGHIVHYVKDKMSIILGANPELPTYVIGGDTLDKYRRRLVDAIVDERDAGAALMAEGLAVPWKPGRVAWQERYEHWRRK